MKQRSTPYLVARFFDGISTGLFLIALPWIILKQQNMGEFVALIALSCTMISFLLTPFFSTLTDRHSRKALLIAVQVIQTLMAFVVFLVSEQDVFPIWFLALAQIVFWVSSGVAWRVNIAFTQENYTPQEYEKISGYQEIVMQVSTMGAGALGVLLLERWGIAQFALFAALGSLISALSYYRTPYTKSTQLVTYQTLTTQLVQTKDLFLQHPKFFAFVLASSLSYPTIMFMSKLAPIWLSEQNAAGHWFAGYQMAFGFGAMLTGFVLTRRPKSWSYPRVMLGGVLVMAAILWVVGIYPSALALVGSALLLGFFNAWNRICRFNWMHERVAIAQRGRIEGGLAMVTTAVQSLGYLQISILVSNTATGWGFLLIAGFVSLVALAMYGLLKTMSL